MGDTLRDLNLQRRTGRLKRPEEETFLLSLNELLSTNEAQDYSDQPEAFPTIFVFGLPRSGTTLMTQFIAHTFDVGFINNLMARFWLAPITGIRLSRILLGEQKDIDFRSSYATTKNLADIHEFGYFWRHWLKKERMSDFVNAKVREEQIDWPGLTRTLLNVQHEFGKPMIYKNIFGAYHLERFVQMLQRVLFVYIERDPLDTAISILEARKKFYTDLNLWWSTCPVEYEQLRGLPHLEQIGGQVYYLRRFYGEQIRAVGGEHVVRIRYRELCECPLSVAEKIQDGCLQYCDSSLSMVADPPSQFEYRQHVTQESIREQFRQILDQYADSDPGPQEGAPWVNA